MRKTVTIFWILVIGLVLFLAYTVNVQELRYEKDRYIPENVDASKVKKAEVDGYVISNYLLLFRERSGDLALTKTKLQIVWWEKSAFPPTIGDLDWIIISFWWLAGIGIFLVIMILISISLAVGKYQASDEPMIDDYIVRQPFANLISCSESAQEDSSIIATDGVVVYTERVDDFLVALVVSPTNEKNVGILSRNEMYILFIDGSEDVKEGDYVLEAEGTYSVAESGGRKIGYLDVDDITISDRKVPPTIDSAINEFCVAMEIER